MWQGLGFADDNKAFATVKLAFPVGLIGHGRLHPFVMQGLVAVFDSGQQFGKEAL